MNDLDQLEDDYASEEEDDDTTEADTDHGSNNQIKS